MKVLVTVTSERYGQDPAIQVDLISAETDSGLWRERVSHEQMPRCLRFLRMGVEMAGGTYTEVRE